jgi:hypothetical protein
MADILYATNRFPGDGVTTQYEISFAGGYMDKAHVKAYIEDATGIRTAIVVEAGMFVGPNTINLGVAAPVGSITVLYRDTPKDEPLVNFVNGSRITEANLDKVAQQAVFIGAEVYDSTRVGEVLALLDNAGAEALAASATAVAAAAAAEVSETNAAASAGVATAAANAAAVAAADADADAIAVAALASSLSGGSIGFTAAAYDMGSITDPNTYFNLDLGTVP